MSKIFFKGHSLSARLLATVLIVFVAYVPSPAFVLAQVVDGETSAEEVVNDESLGTQNDVTEATETIEVFSENNLADEAISSDGVAGEEAPLQETTGGQTESDSAVVIIETGDANAGGALATDVNSIEIQSLLGTTTNPLELDDYTMIATGTNDAEVMNVGTTSAVTGENKASSESNVFVTTGDAVSALNIANVVNTNVINSDGFISLFNQALEGMPDLNLSELFFPGGESSLASSTTCTLVSCAAENITYTVMQTNNATITNSADIEAISGRNEGVGGAVSMSTGESYGAANVINIANTTIIDSNYRLLTVNGIGTLDGDLVLPSEALFRTFFGMPNGMNQVEDAEDVRLEDSNTNTATINNNLNTIAETGLNTALTTYDGITRTGTGYAESNIVNEINKNLFGGDSLYMLIRVHGAWNGNVYGLPEGLTWSETDDGIVIYSTEAEIVPSEILQYDIDSYNAHFNNQNSVAIDNNINISAVSGENFLEGDVGITNTGNAYAGANVLNVANTNVVGRNWVMAIMNIFGDFNGNVSFGRPDLWIGGQVQAAVSPVGPGTKLVYTYTIKNNGDLKATNVAVQHLLKSAHIRYNGEGGESLKAETRQESIGILLPGEVRVISFDAYVDEALPIGTTDVTVEARLTMRESDSNKTDNTETLTVTAAHSQPVITGGGSSGGGGSGGGGGGKSSNRKGIVKGVEVSQTKIDPKSAPHITIKKSANVKENIAVLAGEEVTYEVIVNNRGGNAYNAKVIDRLINPIGAEVSAQSWDLGTIGAGEKITLEYTIKYESDTPSGIYTNTASIEAYRSAKNTRRPLTIPPATHTLEINGQALSIGNVGVVTFVPHGYGKSAAFLAWETIKPTDAQVFYDVKAATSTYNPVAVNYGYAERSYYSPLMSTKHYIILFGLTNGETYEYRLQSRNAEHQMVSKAYTFTVPEPSLVVAQRETTGM